MLKKTLLGVMAVAAMALAVPAMAQASTPVPSLPSGVDPAHIADSLGNPVSSHATVSGRLTLGGALTIHCDNHVSININADGTSEVTTFDVTNCVATGVNCPVTITGTNLNWGDRLGFDTTNGVFRDYVNVSFNLTLGPPCPIQGTFPEAGTLFPEVSISGMTITAAFHNGAGSDPQTGVVSGPLGSATVDGTLSGTITSDETDDDLQLVNTGD